MHRSIVTAVSLGVVLLISACGADPEDDVVENGPPEEEEGDAAEDEAVADDDALEELRAAAEEEGELVWYTAQVPDLVDETVAAFEAEYPGINVEILRLSSGPITTRYEEERASGIVPSDVITAAQPTFFEVGIEEGWLADDVEIPAAEDWPADFRRGGLFEVGIIPLSIAYNTDIVSEDEVPADWEDFLDDQWRGEIILGDPRNVPAYMAQLELWSQTLGDDFLEGLGGQDLRLVDSIVPGNQEMAAGSAAFVIPNSSTALAALVEEGAPVDDRLIEPMTGVEWTTAISADSESPNAARLFLNFLISVEGQEVFNGPEDPSPMEGVGAPLPDGYEPLIPLLEAADEDALLELIGIG